jgi:hypothetical protein
MNWQDPETLWLNVANIALGVVTFVPVFVVIGSVVVALLRRAKPAHS